jgi:hypothetical protein
MSPQDAENFSQEYYESGESRHHERDEESILPWLDESEIVAREYDEEDPWFNEAYIEAVCALAEKEYQEILREKAEHPKGTASEEEEVHPF